MNKNEKFAITINRELGSGGRTVGRLLAERLAVPYYDKALIMALEKKYNLSVEEIERMKGKSVRWWSDFNRVMRVGENPRLYVEKEGDEPDVVTTEVIFKAEKEIPGYNVPHDFQSGSLEIAKIYALTGQKNQANKILNQLEKKSFEYCDYYLSLNSDRFNAQDYQYHIYILNEIVSLLRNQRFSNSDNVAKKLDSYINLYYKKMGYSGAPAEHNVEGDINSDSIIEEGE